MTSSLWSSHSPRIEDDIPETSSTGEISSESKRHSSRQIVEQTSQVGNLTHSNTNESCLNWKRRKYRWNYSICHRRKRLHWSQMKVTLKWIWRHFTAPPPLSIQFQIYLYDIHAYSKIFAGVSNLCRTCGGPFSQPHLVAGTIFKLEVS